MACSTCDGYEFVPDETGEKLVDCPDCRAIDVRPLAWCPVHSVRLDAEHHCRRCLAEARAGIARLLAGDLRERAREIALEAA